MNMNCLGFQGYRVKVKVEYFSELLMHHHFREHVQSISVFQ